MVRNQLVIGHRSNPCVTVRFSGVSRIGEQLQMCPIVRSLARQPVLTAILPIANDAHAIASPTTFRNALISASLSRTTRLKAFRSRNRGTRKLLKFGEGADAPCGRCGLSPSLGGSHRSPGGIQGLLGAATTNFRRKIKA